jgi:hypothetical protein
VVGRPGSFSFQSAPNFKVFALASGFTLALSTAARGKSAKRGEPQIYLVGVTLWAPAGGVVSAFAFPVPRGTGRKQKRAT